MATYSTRICTPYASAPSVTNKVAVCAVCHTQWQVKSEDETDTHGCPFCGVTNDYGAITTYSEAPGYDNVTIRDGS